MKVTDDEIDGDLDEILHTCHLNLKKLNDDFHLITRIENDLKQGSSVDIKDIMEDIKKLEIIKNENSELNICKELIEYFQILFKEDNNEKLLNEFNKMVLYK
jgi:hypothetical protein